MRKIVVLVLLLTLLVGCTPEAAERWQPFWDAVATSVAETPQPVTELPEWDRERPPVDDAVDDDVLPIEGEEMVEEAPCLIKGNIGRKGARIYHEPGQQFYQRVVISLERGERWFCTSEEAEAAGWRRSQR